MKRHNYLQRSLLVLITMFIGSAMTVYGAEESITLTTYYPSPYGVYNEMRLYPKAPPAPGACSEGTMYYNNVDHQLYVCGGSGWQTLGSGYWAANSNDIYNKNLGNVGIGTMSPGAKLDVAGMVQMTGFKMLTGASNNYVLTSDGSGVGTWRLSGLPLGTSGQTLRHDGTNWAANSVLYNNGVNVGIGTTSPISQAKLDVAGPIRVNSIGIEGGAGGGVIYFLNSGGFPNFYLRSASSFANAQSGIFQERFFIDGNTGNVGIGTTGPSYKLDVNGYIRGAWLCMGTDCRNVWPSGGAGSITINGPAGAATGSLFTFTGGGVSQSGSTFTFSGGSGGVSGSGNSNYVPKFTGSTLLGNSQIYDNGSYVGIGTTSPSEKLHVNGNLYVGSNWYKAGNLAAVNNAISMWGAQGGVVSGFSNGYTIGIGQTASGYTGLGITSGSSLLASFYAGSEVGIGAYVSGPPLVRIWAENPAGFAAADILVQRSGTINLRTQQVDRLVIDSFGNVGIGTWPSARLHVVDGALLTNIAVGRAFPGYSASWPYETIGMHPTNNLRINFGSAEKYVFNNTGWAVAAAGGGWTVSSDKRFKDNVVELTDVMRALKNIRGVRFNWKTKDFPQKGFPEGRQIGFIAQEVEQEFPELVATDSEGYKSLDYGKLTPVLLEAVKEQQGQIEELKAENKAMKTRLDGVEQKLK